MAGAPAIAVNLTSPEEFAAAPFASGVPTVRCGDAWAGGLQEGKVSDGPCVRLGAVHALYAGTSGTRMFAAPFGRG